MTLPQNKSLGAWTEEALDIYTLAVQGWKLLGLPIEYLVPAVSLSVHSPGWPPCTFYAKFKISCLWLLPLTAQSAMIPVTFTKCTPQHEAAPLGWSLAWAMACVSPLLVCP